MQTTISTSSDSARALPYLGGEPRLTMYDLPSEFPGERGLPDEYHDLQPEFLSATLSLTQFGAQERFTGTDMCLYYDEAHPLWHKRPDWFLALGVPRLYQGSDLRLSYVVKDEGVAPSVIVELLSPGTEEQDLGPFYRSSDQIDSAVPPETEVDEELGEGLLKAGASAEVQPQKKGKQRIKPPSKWEVYERILQVPYYITYSRYSNQMRCFGWEEGRYVEAKLDQANPRFWLEDLQIGLGLWQGEYQGATRSWLRWFDGEEQWLPTPEEQERKEKLAERQRADSQARRADEAERRAEALLARLKQQGIEVDLDEL